MENLDYRSRYKEALKRQIISTASALNRVDYTLETEVDIADKFDPIFIHELTEGVAQDVSNYQLDSLAHFVELLIQKKIEQKVV